MRRLIRTKQLMCSHINCLFNNKLPAERTFVSRLDLGCTPQYNRFQTLHEPTYPALKNPDGALGKYTDSYFHPFELARYLLRYYLHFETPKS